MRPICQCVLAAILLLTPRIAFGQDFSTGRNQERSPFTDVKFEGATAHVLVDGEWYEWLALDGVPYERIVAGAFEFAPDDWQRRLSEDMLAVLAGLEVRPGASVELELRSLETGNTVVMPAVPATNDNRNLVWRNRWVRAERDHRERLASTKVDADVVFDELIAKIRVHHAYADLKRLDLDALKQEQIERLGEQPLVPAAILGAQRFVTRLGDGHARVEGWRNHAPPGRLGFLLQHAQGGVVAFNREPDAADGSFLDADHPFVESMDGVPIDTWIEAASAYVIDGSPALVRRRSTELIRHANLVRNELQLPQRGEITLTLRNAVGSSTKQILLPISNRRGIYGQWPRTASRILDSGFGYVRLSSMSLDTAALANLERTLDSMANSPGLIIDVRGNGGGRRDVIRVVVPLFLDLDEPETARVVNVAHARLSVGDDPASSSGYLGNRLAFPSSWPGWSPMERAAIEQFAESFDPAWQPPRGRFSEPHYMVVSRAEGQPAYDRPVVVLMDEGCFSATDIFLGALKGLPNVTLMGMPSSGGSARSNRHDIESLGIEVRLATMVSYAPDGMLYDGNGITPDAVVPIIATDLIGVTDTQLDAAIEHLQSRQ